MASPTTGISISTSLRSRSTGVVKLAYETIATSDIVLVVLERRVGLAGGPEVIDGLERGSSLALGLPHGLDPHAHVDLVGVDLLDEVEEADVGAVEQDRG